VDGGGFSDNSRFDVGASVVAPFLWRKKIRTLDLVVLSHPNADHMNGLLFVLRHFRVRELWTNGEPSETAGYQRFRKIVEDKKIFEPEFSRLPRRRRMGGATVTIGNPPPDFFGRSRFEPWRNKNNNSLVLHIRFGRVSFLLPGDVMAAAESEMVQSAGEQMAAHILIAPHHGSRSSNTELFLDTVRPWVAVVSAGMNNRFGFPHPIVRQRYRRRGVPLLRCDRDGAVLCSSDGKSFRLTTFLLSRHRDSPPPVRWEAFIGEGPNDPGEPPTGRENGPDGEKSRRRPLPNRQEREEECRSATSVATETAW
jgi:competence protein ComEC